MKPQFHILIAEDDLISRKILEKSIIKQGHEVTCVANGREALKAFDQRFFPIVITDWMMPEMDGLGLCRAIREKVTQGYVFIVLLTAKGADEDILLGFEAGADDYLTKPFNQTELIARLNTGIRILNQEKTLKNAEQEIWKYTAGLEGMVQARTEQLRDSEEKYRTILEKIEEGYYEVDLSGRLTFFNNSLCKITGYSRNELTGMNSSGLTDKDNAQKLLEEYNRVYQTGLPAKRVDWTLQTKSGDIKFMDNSVSLIKDSEGNPSGFRGIIRDVTERKELENNLLEKTRLAEEASKAKSEFLANLSHEIRTPLNGIIGITEMAMEDCLDARQRKLLEIIDKETNSLSVLINDILDFSKIEARKMELEHLDFELRIMVEDLANAMSLTAKSKGLNFFFLISPDVPLQLTGDPGRLRQILMNLLGNALKFTHKGEILLNIELDQDLGNEAKIRFSVKDTGIGIPAEKQSIIFDGFTQADGSTTRKYGGTGLGTTISKQLAELMGGEIGFESEDGKGSVFWFTVVLGKQTVNKAVSEIKEFDLHNLKVLLVHGNRANMLKLNQHLGSQGCRSKAVSGGKNALAVLKKSAASQDHFQVIVTCALTDDMDGFELSSRIRASKEFDNVSIIVIASSGMKGDANKCKKIGIEGYLTGTTEPEDLCRAISMILGVSGKKEAHQAKRLVTKHSLSEEKRDQNHVQILLVEDYPTNQKVAMRHLRRAGYQVDLAENGQLAVEAFKQKQYDLILMDMQMPVMDGYEATKAIRALEEKSKNETKVVYKSVRTPIIATTAHAMKGDRKLCLDAGMDDYIAKPFRKTKLLATVEKWTERIDDSAVVAKATMAKSACRLSIVDCGDEIAKPQSVTTINHQSSIVNRQSHDAPMNFDQAVAEFEGDREFLMEILGEFLDNVKGQIKTIHQALSEGNAELVRKESHSIKGGAADLTAEGLAELAFELENIGISKALDRGGAVLQKLEGELTRLENFAEVV